MLLEQTAMWYLSVHRLVEIRQGFKLMSTSRKAIPENKSAF